MDCRVSFCDQFAPFSKSVYNVVEKLFRVENCIPAPKKRYSHALRNVGSFPSDPNPLGSEGTGTKHGWVYLSGEGGLN
jgi:hypothetical protein